MAQDQNAKAGFAGAQCSVERTSRSVIDRKLLTALDDKDKVAILATEEDLRIMICALEQYSGGKQRELSEGMKQLLHAAFPPND